MASFDDAYENIRIAKECLNRSAYHEALLNAQKGLELSCKTLFEMAGIEYKKEHDVGEAPFKGLVRKLTEGIPEEYYVKTIQSRLARAMVVLKMLSSVKKIATYGLENPFRLSAKDIFGSYEFGKFIGAIVNEVTGIYWDLHSYGKKLEKR